MGLLHKYLQEAIEEMARDHIKLEFFGDLSALDPELLALCRRTREISREYEGFQVNVCLNYGGRDEIVRAARRGPRTVPQESARRISWMSRCFPTICTPEAFRTRS